MDFSYASSLKFDPFLKYLRKTGRWGVGETHNKTRAEWSGHLCSQPSLCMWSNSVNNFLPSPTFGFLRQVSLCSRGCPTLYRPGCSQTHEICWPLPLKGWDQRCVPPPNNFLFITQDKECQSYCDLSYRSTNSIKKLACSTCILELIPNTSTWDCFFKFPEHSHKWLQWHDPSPLEEYCQGAGEVKSWLLTQKPTLTFTNCEGWYWLSTWTL